MPDQFDPSKTQLALQEGAVSRLVPSSSIAGGSLAGMVRFQNEDLTAARNLLGQLAVAVSGVSVSAARIRAQDAAREAARAAARGDPGRGLAFAGSVAPGVQISLSRQGDQVVATATIRQHLLASWLPAVTVTATAVALMEPQVAAGVPP